MGQADGVVVIDTSSRVGDPLRVSDLVPLRRMLGADSMVIRVNPDGSLVPFEIMPALFYGRSIRQLLSVEVKEQFNEACEAAITNEAPVAFCPDGLGGSGEVMITPILADDGSQCRFLVCWARAVEPGRLPAADAAGLSWEDLRLDDVTARYRTVGNSPKVVEASPWWSLPGRDPIELWPHHSRVAAVGLAQVIMTTLIHDAFGEIEADGDDSYMIRISVPSADVLVGLVPTFQGAFRASGLSPHRVIVGIPVELAVDPDLLPVIVHLRTMGMQIDIVGLDALTATLHTVSDTSDRSHAPCRSEEPQAGTWAGSMSAAVAGLVVSS